MLYLSGALTFNLRLNFRFLFCNELGWNLLILFRGLLCLRVSSCFHQNEKYLLILISMIGTDFIKEYDPFLGDLLVLC